MAADRTIRVASILLLGYGVAVVGNALVWQSIGGWQDASDFPRALIRLAGMGLIAWGLAKRARWAWWAGVLLPSFWILAAILALAAYWAVARTDAANAFPPTFVVFAVISAALLAGAVAFLSKREVRDAFRPRRAEPAKIS